jgi:protein-S-isoprenylcysteine O-methyltransferase Ste14
MYVRLAHQEEREALTEFGEEYAQYAARVPAFFPHFGAADRQGEDFPHV